ncbi:MAG TPA: hypothetical protein VNO32_38260, partial [Candidatus Acidoferrum sp.]|nr:hypothetical protein [Candidatus Acidoferrum sp.]
MSAMRKFGILMLLAVLAGSHQRRIVWAKHTPAPDPGTTFHHVAPSDSLPIPVAAYDFVQIYFNDSALFVIHKGALRGTGGK